jgi:hypothetical protein
LHFAQPLPIPVSAAQYLQPVLVGTLKSAVTALVHRLMYAATGQAAQAAAAKIAAISLDLQL